MAAVDVKMPSEAAAEVWRSGVASSSRELRRGRLGVATLERNGAELLVELWMRSRIASATRSSATRSWRACAALEPCWESLGQLRHEIPRHFGRCCQTIVST